ncbi:MAG: YihY/virulence factor BrkB family protein [Acetobacteraceae bacterium]|nr:YihY/virulence factor BrkB family protein [Acetobacteraceae bacterium]
MFRRPPINSGAAKVLRHPGAFSLAVIKQFRANQGVLLAGAVAYYTLLSLVPLLILVLMVLSHIFPQDQLLQTFGEYLEFIVPGQAKALVDELRTFLAHRQVVGGFLFVTMLFFSALAFTVLENAMSVIFLHRVAIKRRHFLVSAVMPYLFILFLGVGLLIVTVVSGLLQFVGTRTITILGRAHSLDRVSGVLLYLVGVTGEALLISAIYLVMPVGRLSLRHALIGGAVATILWEITRHILAWYYASISQMQVVYGSLTTSVAVLLSVEFGALVLLLGAQVIAEYERVSRESIAAATQPMRTESPPDSTDSPGHTPT